MSDNSSRPRGPDQPVRASPGHIWPHRLADDDVPPHLKTEWAGIQLRFLRRARAEAAAVGALVGVMSFIGMHYRHQGHSARVGELVGAIGIALVYGTVQYLTKRTTRLTDRRGEWVRSRRLHDEMLADDDEPRELIDPPLTPVSRRVPSLKEPLRDGTIPGGFSDRRPPKADA